VRDHAGDGASPAQPALERSLDHQRTVSHHSDDPTQHPIDGYSPITVLSGIPLRVRQAQPAVQRPAPDQPVNHMTQDRIPEQDQVPNPRAISLESLDFCSIANPEPGRHAAARDRQADAPSALEDLSDEVDHHTRLSRIRHRFKGFIILHFGRRNILRSTRSVKDFSPNVPCFRAFSFALPASQCHISIRRRVLRPGFYRGGRV